MMQKYSHEELNQILLSKKLNDFYVATIENREDILTDEEYEKIVKKGITFCCDDKDEVESLINTARNKAQEFSNDFASNLMQVVYSFSQIRYCAILTMIDEDVYDIGNNEFVDLKRNKVIHFDNLTTLYDESNARVRYFEPEEEPQITKRTVLIDVDDESNFLKYEKDHVNQEESDDLTSAFFTEVKGKPYTYKKNK